MSAATFPSRAQLIVLFLLFIGGQFLSVLIILALSALAGASAQSEVPDWAFPIAGVLSMVPMLTYAWRRAGRPPLRLDFSDCLPLRASAAVLVATLLIAFCAGILAGYLPTSEYVPQVGENLRPGIGMFLSIVVIAPLLEEVLCRGILLPALLRKRSPRSSIVISAVFFGLLHLNPAHVIAATILGLVLGYVYYRTRSLALVVGLHAVNNLVAYVGGVVMMGEEATLTTPEIVAQLALAPLAGYIGVRLLRWTMNRWQEARTELQPAPVRVD